MSAQFYSSRTFCGAFIRARWKSLLSLSCQRTAAELDRKPVRVNTGGPSLTPGWKEEKRVSSRRRRACKPPTSAGAEKTVRRKSGPGTTRRRRHSIGPSFQNVLLSSRLDSVPVHFAPLLRRPPGRMQMEASCRAAGRSGSGVDSSENRSCCCSVSPPACFHALMSGALGGSLGSFFRASPWPANFPATPVYTKFVQGREIIGVFRLVAVQRGWQNRT